MYNLTYDNEMLDNFWLLEGRKNIFLSASRSQFVIIGPAKSLKIGQQNEF